MAGFCLQTMHRRKLLLKQDCTQMRFYWAEFFLHCRHPTWLGVHAGLQRYGIAGLHCLKASSQVRYHLF